MPFERGFRLARPCRGRSRSLITIDVRASQQIFFTGRNRRLFRRFLSNPPSRAIPAAARSKVSDPPARSSPLSRWTAHCQRVHCTGILSKRRQKSIPSANWCGCSLLRAGVQLNWHTCA